MEQTTKRNARVQKIIDDSRSGYVPTVQETVDAIVSLEAERAALLVALNAAVERMEVVAEGIPVHNRHKGVSQRAHVEHMAGHLAQHAKIARAVLAKATS